MLVRLFSSQVKQDSAMIALITSNHQHQGTSSSNVTGYTGNFIESDGKEGTFSEQYTVVFNVRVKINCKFQLFPYTVKPRFTGPLGGNSSVLVMEHHDFRQLKTK